MLEKGTLRGALTQTTSNKKMARRPGCTAQPPSTSSARAEKQSEDISARVLMIDRADRARSEEGARPVGRCLDADATQKINGSTGVPAFPRASRRWHGSSPTRSRMRWTTTGGSPRSMTRRALRGSGCFRAVAPTGAGSTIDEPCRRRDASTARASCRQRSKAKCTRCFRTLGHLGTNAPSRFRPVGMRGHGRAVLGRHFREDTESERATVTTSSQDGPGRGSRGFYQEILCIAISVQTRQDLPKR